MFLCIENFFGKFSHSAYEYWNTFPTFKPLSGNIYLWEQARGGGSLGTKFFFAFLHDSEHVLILIFESGKKCKK